MGSEAVAAVDRECWDYVRLWDTQPVSPELLCGVQETPCPTLHFSGNAVQSPKDRVGGLGRDPTPPPRLPGWRVWHRGAREPEEDAVCPVSQRVCLGLDTRERTGLVYASVIIFAELFMLSPT